MPNVDGFRGGVSTSWAVVFFPVIRFYWELRGETLRADDDESYFLFTPLNLISDRLVGCYLLKGENTGQFLKDIHMYDKKELN